MERGYVECDNCDGKGYVECEYCDGKGKVEEDGNENK